MTCSDSKQPVSIDNSGNTVHGANHNTEHNAEHRMALGVTMASDMHRVSQNNSAVEFLWKTSVI